jgi:hypothetical protein
MRQILLSILVVVSTGCVIGDPAPTPGGDDTGGDDDGGSNGSGSGSNPTRTCSLPDNTADTGDLTALKAQQCNVSGTQGARKWYRLSATLPGSMDVVQIELWDGLGAFTGGAVAVGTYNISGAELAPATCGVCVRGLGDKGQATQKEYFATGGSVQVTAVGGNGTPISATLTNATFAEVDPTAKTPVSGGCTATVSRAKVSGTVVTVGGGGGGGGGGGACPATIGD